MTSENLRIVFLIPSGIGTGYTGPGIFLKRLINGSKLQVKPIIYAGLRTGHKHDPQYVPDRWIHLAGSGVLDQIRWALMATFWLLLDHKKYDVVHFHGTFVFKIIPAISCWILKKPYVLVPLSSDADMSVKGKLSGNRLIKPLRRKIVQHSAHGFALGEAISRELVNAGMPQGRVSLIQNPVSSEYFTDPAEDRFSKRHIVFIGVLGDRKRALFVLDVFKALRDSSLAKKCTFFGPFESPEFQELFDDRVEQLELNESVEHISFSEEIDRFLLENASLFLLPSRQEGIPGALVESISAGVPCVVTDVGSMRQVLTESNAGIVVDPTLDSVVEACGELLSNRALWLSKSKSGRNYAVSKLSAEAIGDSYCKVMNNL